jgi:hypothetical protein
MGSYYSGRAGSLILDDKPVAKVRDWSIEMNVDLLDATTLGDFARTQHPSTKSATGSCTLLYYRLDSSENTAYKEFTSLLSKIMHTGRITRSDLVTLKLRVGSGNPDASAADDTIQIRAFITNASIAVSNGELTAVPIQFTVEGDWIGVVQPTF